MNAPRLPSHLAPRPSSLAGFTLVETIMSALVLAVGILAVLGAEQNSRRLGEAAARHRAAVDAAASRLDSLAVPCRPGWPSVLTPAVAVAVPLAPAPPRPVRVETLLSCGARP